MSPTSGCLTFDPSPPPPRLILLSSLPPSVSQPDPSPAACVSAKRRLQATTLYTKALAIGPTATVSALSAGYPAITLILARIFLNEKISTNSAIGMALTLAGAYFFTRK